MSILRWTKMANLEKCPENNRGAVIWLSHGFGYNGDLLYFGEIFRAFERLCSPITICVDAETEFRNPYKLPLSPILKFWRIPLSRKVHGAEYNADVAIPSPFFLFPLLRSKPRALIIIEFTPTALLGVIGMLLRPSIARILLVESDPSGRGGSKKALVLSIKRWVVKKMDVIQTNTESGRNYLVNDLGAKPERVHVLPYLTSRPPGPEANPTVPGPVLKLLFVNSLSERKGIAQFIEALGHCSEATRARLHLTIVGDGPLREALTHRISELGLTGCITFVGARPYGELNKYFSAADVLVIPSLADYRSLSSYEGLSYGLALLASKFDGATVETTIENENGFIIDPSASDDFAHKLEALVQNASRVHSFKKRSLKLYHEQFSVDTIARNISHVVGFAEQSCRVRSRTK